MSSAADVVRAGTSSEGGIKTYIVVSTGCCIVLVLSCFLCGFKEHYLEALACSQLLRFATIERGNGTMRGDVVQTERHRFSKEKRTEAGRL